MTIFVWLSSIHIFNFYYMYLSEYVCVCLDICTPHEPGESEDTFKDFNIYSTGIT